MSNTGSTIAQLAAQRRREKILNNSGNRLKLVTGHSEQLDKTSENPLGLSASRNTTSRTARRGLPKDPLFPVRIFSWPARIILNIIFFLFWTLVPSAGWITVRFISGFIFVEFSFLCLQWTDMKNYIGCRQYLNLCFAGDDYTHSMDPYLDLASVFLGFQGKRAHLFRCIVVYGMQIAADFVLYTFLFIIHGSLALSRS